jgi:hypothetical protein
MISGNVVTRENKPPDNPATSSSQNHDTHAKAPELSRYAHFLSINCEPLPACLLTSRKCLVMSN